MTRITGRSAFLQVLVDEGVTHMFGNPGTTELPIMEVVPEFPQLEFVLGLQESIVARLTEVRCAIPAGFLVETRYLARPPAAWAPDQRLACTYDLRDAAEVVGTAPTDPARLRITITRGQATHGSYTFAESHIFIGRSAQPIDGRGRLRTNHVVFLEDGDDHSRTVGRAHASIRYDATRREYRLYDDGSHNGTRVMRDGALLDVKPNDPVGVTLRSGDEIQLGAAALRVQI